MELADQQVADNELSQSGIETGSPVQSDAPGSTAPASERSDKPLSLRETINKSVEAVRTEEAKRARAADGKFTKLDGAADKPATDTVPKPETNAQPEVSKPVGPPSGWSKEAKAVWDQLPEAVKADAVRREAEVSKGFDEYRNKSKQYEAIEQVLAPVRSVFQQMGAKSDAEAISNLISWEAGLRNPATQKQAFVGLARQLGVDLSTLVPSSSSQLPSAAQDVPEPLRPVIDQFGNIVQQVQSFDARLQNWEQSQTEREISSFAKDKPHFENVRALMGQLMAGGAARDLDSAYQQAIKIHPEVSAKIQAEAEEKRAADLATANAEKVRKAAAAAISPSGSRPPSGSPNQQGKKTGAGIRDSILNAVNQLREEQRA